MLAALPHAAEASEAADSADARAAMQLLPFHRPVAYVDSAGTDKSRSRYFLVENVDDEYYVFKVNGMSKARMIELAETADSVTVSTPISSDCFYVEAGGEAECSTDSVTAALDAIPEARTQTQAPLQQFHREITHRSFVPKGQWITGVSVTYSQSNQDNYNFLIIENLNGDSYTFKVSPMVLFAFKNDLAAGGRFAYSRTRTRLKSADVVLGSDTEYNIDHLFSISHKYTATGAFRMYLSLGDNTRFGMFNELQLELGGGQSKIANGMGQSLTGTYETHFDFSVGLAPGIVCFLNNYSALEVNVGVLGYNYTHTKSVSDQIYVAHRRSRNANFKINLFSIMFGVTFYL